MTFPPSPGDRRPSGPTETPNSFADVRYLQSVIEHLRETRRSKRLSRKRIATDAKITEEVILKAERGTMVPNSTELKAWAAAMDLAMESVWSACLPPSRDGQHSSPNGSHA